MKKHFTPILFVAFALVTRIAAQSPGDVAMVLQKCIDLPDLQQFFPVNNDGSLKQLYILQHGVSFPTNINVSKAGRKVQFIDKKQLAAVEIISYFLFWEFIIDQNSAKVDFIYNYQGADNIPKMYRVIIEMQRAGNGWTATSTETEGR